MDILHGHLEAIEGPGLGPLDLLSEIGPQILDHNPI